MEILNNWISGINDLLWSYVLIIMLLGCAFRFTFKTRFVQFRMFREMIRVLGDSANKAHEGESTSHPSRHSPYRLPAVSGQATWRE